MSKKKPRVTKSDLATLDACVAEANRRERRDFDGLLGQIPGMTQGGEGRQRLLVADILTHLREYLLDRYPEDKLRALLVERAPNAGPGNATPVADDVALAMDLLNSIASATRCTGQRFGDLFFGVRDTNRQGGTKRPRGSRMPQLDAWLDMADLLKSNDDLWNSIPDSDGDADLYRDGSKVIEVNRAGKERSVKRAGFDKRVTEARKRR